jgi:hypothetical protein
MPLGFASQPAAGLPPPAGMLFPPDMSAMNQALGLARPEAKGFPRALA